MHRQLGTFMRQNTQNFVYLIRGVMLTQGSFEYIFASEDNLLIGEKTKHLICPCLYLETSRMLAL